MSEDINELFRAAKNGDKDKAEHIGNELKNSLSHDKREMLEKALDDREYLKQLLSSEKALKVIEDLKKRGIE